MLCQEHYGLAFDLTLAAVYPYLLKLTPPSPSFSQQHPLLLTVTSEEVLENADCKSCRWGHQMLQRGLENLEGKRGSDLSMVWRLLQCRKCSAGMFFWSRGRQRVCLLTGEQRRKGIPKPFHSSFQNNQGITIIYQLLSCFIKQEIKLIKLHYYK